MNLTTNDLLIVIGEQTLEIKMLRITVEAQEKRLNQRPEDNVVPIGGTTGSGGADGTS